MKKLLFLLLLPLLLVSCGIIRGTGDAYRPDEPLSITAKLSAKVGIDEAGQSVGGILRMRRDQVIQLSLTKFGIEGARIIFTPDSLFVIDRLHKRYAANTYAAFVGLLPDARPLTFTDFQTFFWNDRNRSREEVSTTVGLIFPLEMRIKRSKIKTIEGHKIPQNTHVDLNIFDKEVDLDLTLSKVKINYNWNARTTIPEGYTPIDTATLGKLLRKALQ